MTDTFDQLKAALADRYAIERELGAGGMATVYLAEDLKLHRKVAVKVLRPELAAALGPDRFLQEIDIAAKLTHPHILPLHDCGEAKGFLYYVMPFVEGESLRDKLAHEGELPIGEAVRILRDVVDALTDAHAHGVVHRDIKPDNVLLTKHHAVVTDFGIAKAVSEATGRQKLTTAGVALGTPAYMAPEQAAADPHIDHRADIYAVGALAYELLTGRPPFTGTTSQEVLSAHVTQTPEPVTKYRDTVPPALEQLVMKCLEKKAADRWQTTEELLSQLEALTTPSGGITPTDTRPVTGVGVPSRNRRAMIGAGAVIVALAAVGLLTLRGPANPDLDPNLLAIAPFDLVAGDARLEEWREGISDIVSRQLDGVGPLTTLSTAVSANRWGGRADPANAAALGHATGAGLVVFGTVIGSGPDSARVTAALYDVVKERVIAEVELHESRDRVDLLADSLSLRLASALNRERQFGSVRLSNIGSRSPAAVKAFLRGEAWYRRAAWDSAIHHFQEAVRFDSAFALGWWRLGLAKGWTLRADGGPAELARAGDLNRGLPPRESLLIRASTLSATAWDRLDSLWAERRTEYWGTLRRAVRRYPQEPGTWLQLGDALFHHGFSAEEPLDSALAAFDKALALDSTMVEPFLHAVHNVTHRDGGVDAVRYLEAFLRTEPAEMFTTMGTLVLAIVDSGLTGGALGSRIAAVEIDNSLVFATFALMRWPGPSEPVLAVSAELARREPARRGDLHANVQALRGRLREAVETESPTYSSYLRVLASTWGALPGDTALERFDAAVQEFESGSIRTVDFLGWYMALPWLAQRRETARLRRALDAVRSWWRQQPDSVRGEFRGRATNTWHEALATGYLALARADTAAALDLLSRAHSERFTRRGAYFNEYLTRARLLAATGRDAEALTILERGGMNVSSNLMPYAGQVLWIVERGRIHRRLGHRDEALRDFSYVAGIWETADDVLQPLVQEAREAVAELTAER